MANVPTPTTAGDEPVSVRVEPATADQLEALIEGPLAFTAGFGIPVEPGYLSFDGVLEHSLEAITTGGVPAEWYTHLFFDRRDGALIGIGGFKGPPEAGTVEIGYEIAPARRGRGAATSAATALIETARAEGCTAVIAHTLAERNPSTSVLTTLGFALAAELDDPDDGPVWRWELPLDPAAGAGATPAG